MSEKTIAPNAYQNRYYEKTTFIFTFFSLKKK